MFNAKRMLSMALGQGVLAALVFGLQLDQPATLLGFGAILLVLSTTSVLQKALVDPRVPVVLAVAMTQGWRAGVAVSVSAAVATIAAGAGRTPLDQSWLVLVGAVSGIAGGVVDGAGALLAIPLFAVLYEVARQGRQLLEQSKALMLASGVSVSLLAVVLPGSMGDWSIFIVGMVLLVMHQSMRLYSEVQHAYEVTILATADAVEAGNADKQGHGRRVAEIAVRVGKVLRLPQEDLRLLWRLALLHELKLGQAGQLHDAPSPVLSAGKVTCFADVLPVLAAINAGTALTDHRLGTLAYIVCKASNIDDAIGGGARGEGWYSEICLRQLASDSSRQVADAAFREVLA